MSTPTPDTVQQPVTKKEGFNYAALLARLMVVLMLSASLGLVWWSYYKVFFPELKKARELDLTTVKLNAELMDMNHRWSDEELAEINRQVAMLDTNLFIDQNELQSWLADVRDQATPADLDVKADFAGSLLQTDAPPRFLVIPTTLTIQFHFRPGPARGPSPYQRLLRLTQTITSREKADCLNELTVESGPVSIERAVMNFNFWAGTNTSK